MHPSDPQGQPPPGEVHPPAHDQPPPPYPYPPPRRTNGMAIAAMVVSLASLFACPLVGAVGIYLGSRAREEIRRSGEEGDGMAQAGIIVGWIAIALSVVYVCLFAGIFGLAALPAFA